MHTSTRSTRRTTPNGGGRGTPESIQGLRNGIQLKVVSQRVGHASPMVTLAIYQHVLPGDDRAAADIGAELIFGVG